MLELLDDNDSLTLDMSDTDLLAVDIFIVSSSDSLVIETFDE
jgi:hypothetical protein